MKIIASDFDRTLCYNGEVSQEDINAIRKFRQNGNKFGIVTGRDFELSKWMTFRKNFTVDFVISCTGAIITDETGKIIFEKKGKTGRFLKCLIEKSISLDSFAFNITNGLVKYSVDITGNIPYDDSIMKEFTHCNTWFENTDNAREFAEYVSKYHSDKINVFQNEKNVDMPPLGISKTSGIYEYAKLFDKPEIYTVGDNYNDIPMLKEFNGFAVGNAVEEVKKVANSECDRICDIIEYIMK